MVTAPAIAGPAPLPSEALRARLLTETELPPGFAALPLPADIGLPPASGPGKSSTEPQECTKVLAPVSEQQPGAAGNAAARFGGPGFTSIDVDVAAYSGDGAAQAFTNVQRILRQCGSYRGKDADGVPVTYAIQPYAGIGAGNAAATFALHTTSDDLTITSATVVAVVGSAIFQLSVSGPRDPGRELLERLARSQTGRLS